MSKLDENLTENICNGNPLMRLFSGPHLVRSHPREALDARETVRFAGNIGTSQFPVPIIAVKQGHGSALSKS